MESSKKLTGLLIIDIQKDYFERGRMPLVEPLAASEIAGELLRLFRLRNMPVFHVHHVSTRSNASFFLPGTDGIIPDPLVAPAEGEEVIIKHHPNSFLDTELNKKLTEHNVKNLIIVGMMTHMCIDSTTRAASDLGFNCNVIYDGCTTRDLAVADHTISSNNVHDAFMAALDGTFAKVMKFSEFLMNIDELM